MKRGTSNSRCHVCSYWSSTLLNVSDRSESVSRPCNMQGRLYSYLLDENSILRPMALVELRLSTPGVSTEAKIA
jgi:hypothetical protein